MTTKTESRFYIEKKITGIKNTLTTKKDTLKTKINAQTQKHITKRVKTSQAFISDLKKKDIRKEMDSLVDTNKKRVKDFAGNSKKTYKTFINDSKKTATNIVKGVQADARLVRDDINNFKNKPFDKKVAKKNIENKIKSVTSKISSPFIIPNRKQILSLMADIEVISKKVDSLNKQYA